jgi:N6-L-threonylcarbamoyladenine synthase
MCAKGLAAGAQKPLISVNHLAGHALTPRMTDNIEFPYLMLLVSGGHCQFLIVHSVDKFTRLGGTIDDAPGEAFDKTAKLLGLGYPGGPMVEETAKNGDAQRFKFPRPLLDRPGCDMSFSGLKTALRRARDVLVADNNGLHISDRADLCAGFQDAITDTLVEKTKRACLEFLDQVKVPLNPVLAVAGGVAANTEIRNGLQELCTSMNFQFLAPPLKYCTDNAAMIAWVGVEKYRSQNFSDLTLAARPRWPLDQSAKPMLGSGKKGAKA